MPRGDGTGPLGQGPLTGRGMGFCAGFNTPGFMNPGFRGFRRFARGFARGFGRGLGFRRLVTEPVLDETVLNEEEEKKILEANLEDLKAEIKEIEKRLKELNPSK